MISDAWVLSNCLFCIFLFLHLPLKVFIKVTNGLVMSPEEDKRFLLCVWMLLFDFFISNFCWFANGGLKRQTFPLQYGCLCKKETRHCSFGDLLRKINITLALPAISNFAFTFAVVDVKPAAVSFTGTKPTLVNNSSSLVQALRAMKKPLSFVCARTLYGVSAREMLTFEIGAPFFDWTRPVITWPSQVQASQAAFSVPLTHVLEQSKK